MTKYSTSVVLKVNGITINCQLVHQTLSFQHVLGSDSELLGHSFKLSKEHEIPLYCSYIIKEKSLLMNEERSRGVLTYK